MVLGKLSAALVRSSMHMRLISACNVDVEVLQRRSLRLCSCVAMHLQGDQRRATGLAPAVRRRPAQNNRWSGARSACGRCRAPGLANLQSYMGSNSSSSRALEQGVQQRDLVLEVEVDGALREPGAAGDVVHAGGVVALRHKQADRAESSTELECWISAPFGVRNSLFLNSYLVLALPALTDKCLATWPT